jgi:hypothetical protein
MADLLGRADVHELIARCDELLVSVFLPTHRTAPDVEQDPIRLRNLLDQAAAQASAAGVRGPEVRELLEPARSLLAPAEAGFWNYQSDGLALFLARGFFRLFRLPVELPELVVVGERFHVKPLLGLLCADQRFYVLALSQNEVRLLEGTRQRVEEVELRDVPQDLREALRFDELEKQRLFHIAGAGQAGPVVFHGHGIGGEVDKALLERYLRQVDDGLWATVLRDERAPLVLAGVEYEQSMFRGLTRYRHVLDQGIDGNPEQLSPQALHRRALEIVEPVINRSRNEAAGRYRQAAGRGQGAEDIEQVVRAAFQGRVESLFVAVGIQQWGTVDADTLEMTVHEERQSGDEDLLDLAAVHTMLHSGDVFALQPGELPGAGPAAALLRY